MRGNKDVRWRYAFLLAGLMVLVAVIVVVAGCGGGTTTTTAAPTETTAAPTETTAAPTETTAAAAPETLKIGLIEPMSGPISVVGLSFKRGYELYADKVKADGGVQIGDKKYLIEIISEDGKGNPEASGTAAKKIVYEDKAAYVAGEIIEPASDAIYGVTSTAPTKTMHILSWVNFPYTPTDVSASKPLQIRLAIGPQDTHGPDLDYLMKAYPKAKKIVLSYSTLPSETLVKDLKDAVAARPGLEVIGETVWEWGTTDFVPAMSKAVAMKPDVIIGMTSAQADAQLRAARDLGFKGVFISTSPLAPEFFVKTAGNEACTDVIVNGMDMTKATPEMKAVQDASMAKYNEFVSDELIGYDQVWTLVQLMQKAASIDPLAVDGVIDQMTTDGSLLTTYGPGRLTGANDQYGANRAMSRPVSVVRLMNGQPELIGLVPVPDKTK